MLLLMEKGWERCSSVLTNGLAEVDGVFELLPEDGLGRVARHLEQEEAGVALGQEVVRRVVLVHDLRRKTFMTTN